MIRILHVLGGLNLGGAESRIMDLYRKIDRTKFQFDFVIHNSEKQIYEDEVELLGGIIYRFNRFKLFNIFSYSDQWKKFFKSNSIYRIIHGHIATSGFIYLYHAKKNNVYVRIAHARSSKKDNLIKLYISKFSRFFANYYFAVSLSAAQSEFGKRRLGDVIFLPNGIDYQKFIFSMTNRSLIRKKLSIKDNDYILGHVGRFHKAKNHSFIINLGQELLKHNLNFKILLIGEGPLKNKIIIELKKKNLMDRFIIVDALLGIDKYYSAMDIFILPSKYEGLPGVLLEAQVNGLKCLISNNITNEVVISDKTKSLSINSNAIHSWVSEILMSSAQNNIDDRENKVNMKFEISTAVRELEFFYRKSLEKK